LKSEGALTLFFKRLDPRTTSTFRNLTMIAIRNDSLRPKFPLGRLLATPGSIEALARSGQSPGEFLARHAGCDWGEVCDDDKALNEDSLRDGSRLLSAYRTHQDVRVWIITEAADEHGHRICTTLLLPEEY
jgi:hypothetical protein